MNTIIRKCKFIIRNIINKIIYNISNLLLLRNRKIILIGCSPFKNDKFMHNTKYLFLFLNTHYSDKYITIWLCRNDKTQKYIKKYGYKNAHKTKTIIGFYYKLRAKYWFTDYQFTDIIDEKFFGGSIRINLWHGIPLKFIEYDDPNISIYHKLNNLQKKIYNILKIKDSYYNVNSEYEQACYETAFLTDKEKIKILGSPRLDVLLHDIPNAEMFMEEDFNNIKKFKAQGKKIFIYMPTFRDTGKDISGWLKSNELKEFLHNNNAMLVCKLHPFDKNSLDFKFSEDFYKMESDSDVYPILKYTDALITDYSSVAFDYLLLDKPIIYHVPDLQEYQDTCRGFYMPYEEFAVGDVTKNEEDIFTAMQNVIDGVDNYKEQRKVLRDKMFVHQDGKNCERVVEWIKSLDK